MSLHWAPPTAHTVTANQGVRRALPCGRPAVRPTRPAAQAMDRRPCARYRCALHRWPPKPLKICCGPAGIADGGVDLDGSGGEVRLEMFEVRLEVFQDALRRTLAADPIYDFEK